MGHAQHGHAGLSELDHDVEHLFDHFRIQRGCGLIEQHDLGGHAQASRDGDTLLLTTRELGRILFRLLGNLYPLQVLHGGVLGILAGHFAHPDGTQGEVVQHGQMRKQIEVLEHHADFTPDQLDVLEVVAELRALDPNLTLLVFFQTIQTTNQGGLSGARWAANNDTFTLLAGEVDVLEDVKLTEPLVHIHHLDHDFFAN